MIHAAAAQTSSTAQVPGPASAKKPGRARLLLDLVRKVIDYGKELANTVRQRIAADRHFARHAFGSSDLALIVASIARGLLLASALEARLVRRARHLDMAPRPTRAAASPQPRAPRPPTAHPALPLVPTPEQAAAWVRRRPIGAIVADICRDLGIPPRHQLWPELSRVISVHGGSLVRLMTTILDRALPLTALATVPAAGPGPAAPLAPAPVCTGPP